MDAFQLLLRSSVRCRARFTPKPLHRLHFSTQPPLTRQSLTWPDYLAIRKSKRRWELATTFPSMAICFGGGVAYFGSVEIDSTKPIFGIEPLYVYVFATLATAGFGYLIGPTIGSSIWRLTHRRTMNLIELKDREFLERIKRNRVNPTAQSAVNPVPDYYGEKIGSISQYRQWLRDQSKYRKRAQWLEDK